MSTKNFRGGILPAEAQRRRKQTAQARKAAQLARAAELARQARLAMAAQPATDAQLAMMERVASAAASEVYAEHAQPWRHHVGRGRAEEISR
jgi:hypothetical protein